MEKLQWIQVKKKMMFMLFVIFVVKMILLINLNILIYTQLIVGDKKYWEKNIVYNLRISKLKDKRNLIN